MIDKILLDLQARAVYLRLAPDFEINAAINRALSTVDPVKKVETLLYVRDRLAELLPLNRVPPREKLTAHNMINVAERALLYYALKGSNSYAASNPEIYRDIKDVLDAENVHTYTDFKL